MLASETDKGNVISLCDLIISESMVSKAKNEVTASKYVLIGQNQGGTSVWTRDDEWKWQEFQHDVQSTHARFKDSQRQNAIQKHS